MVLWLCCSLSTADLNHFKSECVRGDVHDRSFITLNRLSGLTGDYYISIGVAAETSFLVASLVCV
jgi:hypothetical protein